MIYMVECALNVELPHEDWMDWVNDMKPPTIILTVPGVSTAQRLKGINLTPAPYFAMYSVAAPDILVSQKYRDVGGGRLGTRPDRWNDKIGFWNRDLFDGLDRAPDVPMDAVLAVVDRSSPEPIDGADFQWLEAVGLDRSTAWRGLAVLPAAMAEEDGALRTVAGLRLFRPIMPQAVADHGLKTDVPAR